MDYTRFIQDKFEIITKDGKQEEFVLNKIQLKFLEEMSGRDICLKARQQGFSSLITAMHTADFILKNHSYGVIIADSDENAEGLLDKCKKYIESYQIRTGVEVPLKYNSKFEIVNKFMESKLSIGTAKNTEFGRSKTITNLHLSEVAFFPNIRKIIAGAGNALVPSGRITLETTANGYNDFRKLYYEAKSGENDFKPLFYKASDFYTPEFLAKKRIEQKDTFAQEYPENDSEAFLTSGETYFDKSSLKIYMNNVRQPI